MESVQILGVLPTQNAYKFHWKLFGKIEIRANSVTLYVSHRPWRTPAMEVAILLSPLHAQYLLSPAAIYLIAEVFLISHRETLRV